MAPEKDGYKADQIQVLEGLEAVRKRPAMYIGSTGEAGLHHLVYEVVDNSVDEAMNGHCDTIEVMLHSDGSCSVKDNGRGIPVDDHPVYKVPAVEIVTEFGENERIEDQYALIKNKAGTPLRVLSGDTATIEETLLNFGASANSIPADIEKEITFEKFDPNVKKALVSFSNKNSTHNELSSIATDAFIKSAQDRHKNIDLLEDGIT